ncbi:MAG: glycosyltransferase family 4 protein [Rhodospirillaceae bacterium]
MARLALIIAGMGPGGAERVMSNLANAWAARSDHVSLITLAPPEPPPFFPLHPAIEYRPLGLMARSAGRVEALRANLYRLVRLRRAIAAARPDAVLSFGTEMNVLTVLATLGLGLLVVVSERADPRHYPYGRSWRLLRRVTYPLADWVVVQTKTVAALFGGGRRVVIIPNPLPTMMDAPTQPPTTRPLATRPCIIAAGRMTAQKGFDLLLEAFSRVAADHPTWSLIILGDGEQRAALTNRANAPDLAGRVLLPGVVDDPAAVMRGADLFMLPSRFEGFPNVLCEAMACGLPVIAADCDSGPRDIVTDGVDGLLIPPDDIDALAAALDRLLADAALREKLAAAAPALSVRLALPAILARWDALLVPSLTKKD